ncbi:helix-turn-helix domain-containing protein [Rhodococcus sp. SJ]|uniref:helix-turn-helix domain-containing protein n=1 Tax=Rhodococcus sp. SJ TaxID=3434112 RepID=UPI003D79A703
MELGWSQEVAADHIGIHWTHLGQVERGQRSPTACIRGAGIGRSSEIRSCALAGKAREPAGAQHGDRVANDPNSGGGVRILAGSALRSCVVRCRWPGRWPTG